MKAGVGSSKLMSDDINRVSDIASENDIPLRIPVTTGETIAEIVPTVDRTPIDKGGT